MRRHRRRLDLPRGFGHLPDPFGTHLSPTQGVQQPGGRGKGPGDGRQHGRLAQAGGGPAGTGAQEGIERLEDATTGPATAPLSGQPDGPKQRAQGIGPAAVGHGGWLLAARTGRGVGLILLPALLEGEGPQCAAPGLHVGFQRVAVNWLIRYDQGTGDDHLHDEPPSLVVTQPKDQVHCCLGHPTTCPSTTFWVRPPPTA